MTFFESERAAVTAANPRGPSMPCTPAVKPTCGHERRDIAVLRRPARVKRLGHRPEHLAQPGRLRGGEADRPDHLPFVETQQLADGRGGTEDAGGARHVPAHVVVRRIHRVGHTRLGLEAQHEGFHEVPAGHRVRAGVGEERRRHRRCGMGVVLRRRVVVVVDVRADAVHQRRVQRIEPLHPSQHAGRRRTRERRQRPQRAGSTASSRAPPSAHPT